MTAASIAFFGTGILTATEPASTAGDPAMLEQLKSLQADVQAISGPCADATVCIVGSANGRTASGSGVVVSEEGIILTAAHVIDGFGDMATVFFPNGNSVPAKVLGADFDRDAAMLQIVKEGSYPHVEMSDRRAPDANQWCVAMGHPGGFDPERTPVLRLGRVLVSGDFILTDCTVVGGDSGGPLFDPKGRLIGVHSSIGFGLNENRHVPVAVFLDSWDRLKSGERYGTRFSTETPQAEPEKPAVFGQVDAEGKDDLDRFLDESLKPGNGQAELRLSPEVLQRFGGMETILRRLNNRSAKAAEDKPEGNPGAPTTPDAPADGADPTAGMELLELMNKSRQEGTPLNVTPELLEKMGGMEGLMRQLKALGLSEDGNQPSGTQLPDELKIRDPFIESILAGLKEITRPQAPCVGTLMSGETPLSLATVVGARGYLVAPDLNEEPGDLNVRLGDRVLEAKVVKHYPRHGMMLLKVEATGLQPMDWDSGSGAAEVGTLVISPAPDGEAFGFGMVGVKERNTIDTPFLGVGKADAEGGVRVGALARRGPADTAGVLVGDVILAISGNPITKETMSEVLKQFSAGDEVNLEIQRGQENLTLGVKLLPSLFRMQAERLRVMNSMSGPTSPLGASFARALQHDIPLTPQQCGGPLLDLTGHCIGINLSRAGRVETLAVPAATVMELIKPDIAP